MEYLGTCGLFKLYNSENWGLDKSSVPRSPITGGAGTWTCPNSNNCAANLCTTQPSALSPQQISSGI